MFDTNVYKAIDQVEATAKAIIKDPYLMPACPLIYPIFDDLRNDDIHGTGRKMALTHIKIILRASESALNIKKT